MPMVSNKNIQYSLRRERPVHSAYLLSGKVAHSIACSPVIGLSIFDVSAAPVGCSRAVVMGFAGHCSWQFSDKIPGRTSDVAASNAPSIFDAIEEQLGLKLESGLTQF